MLNDEDLLRFVQDFRAGLLDGKPPEDMCYVICHPLQCLLSASGVDTDLLEVMVPEHITQIGCKANHFVLRLTDGRILDPTADQFPETGFPDVYLGPIPDFYEPIGATG